MSCFFFLTDYQVLTVSYAEPHYIRLHIRTAQDGILWLRIG